MFIKPLRLLIAVLFVLGFLLTACSDVPANSWVPDSTVSAYLTASRITPVRTTKIVQTPAVTFLPTAVPTSVLPIISTSTPTSVPPTIPNTLGPTTLSSITILAKPSQSVLSRRIVFDGDSLTAGQNVVITENYTYQVMQFPEFRSFFWNNVALGDFPLTDITHRATTEVDVLFTPSTRQNIVVIWAGAYDLMYSDSNPSQTIQKLKIYCEARHSIGFKVVILDYLPRQEDSKSNLPGFETRRNEANNLLRSQWQTFADGFVDIASDSTIGQPNQWQNTKYYIDKTRLTKAGYTIVANKVKEALLALK